MQEAYPRVWEKQIAQITTETSLHHPMRKAMFRPFLSE